MFYKNGIINLNKPVGMSSSLAVQIVKRKLKPNKIGHLGTLDPLGTGVLLLAVNKSTKLFDTYLTKRKTYRTIFKFGEETETLDSEGVVIKKNDVQVTEKILQEKIKLFIGTLSQMPPAYSAKKINGKKSYELARQGIDVILKPREVNIYKFNIIEKVAENTFCFDVECSAGTYIRSICRDLAHSLSTYGTMVAIIRTICGDFDIKDSCTLEQIENGELSFTEIE